MIMNVCFPSMGILSLLGSAGTSSLYRSFLSPQADAEHKVPAFMPLCSFCSISQHPQRRWFSTAAASQSDCETKDPSHEETQSSQPIQIAIVGGGIAGVSVAHALSKQYAPHHTNIHITVYEAEPACPGNTKLYRTDEPCWTAATARNANSIVPGVAMHVFSRPSTLRRIWLDSWSEFWMEHQRYWPTIYSSKDDHSVNSTLFERPPPYFALHLGQCIGWSATNAERLSFLYFGLHFLKATFMGDANERGRHLHQLASANRFLYLQNMDKTISTSNSRWGHSKGFLSLYRSRQQALDALQNAQNHGETAEYVDWQTIVQKIPPSQLVNLPTKYHGVRRDNDYTASCELFVQDWVQECLATGLVDYLHCGKVTRVERIYNKKADNGIAQKIPLKQQKPKYRVTTQNGTTQEFDLLVLSAGPTTSLLANQLGALRFCPTYPLRGFSLTVFMDKNDTINTDSSSNCKSSNAAQAEDVEYNLVREPFSVDSLYCTSISPGMARLAGFGEFVGYNHTKKHAIPSQGPNILQRYAQHLFPKAIHTAAQYALPGFRCLSPDDLPLVGEVPTSPGLFIHTGHGTLGWTCGLATGVCMAQAVLDRVEDREPRHGTFVLPDGSTMDRQILSPERFRFIA